MHELERLNLVEVVTQAAASKPFLGICLGPQALLETSEENGGIRCLGILPGQVKWFGDQLRDPVSGVRIKIPHMGWNQVQQTIDHPLWRGIPQNSRFYFVHSYYLQPARENLIAGQADYAFRFTAAIADHNIFAVQFHPEKSAREGLRLLTNFVSWTP